MMRRRKSKVVMMMMMGTVPVPVPVRHMAHGTVEYRTRREAAKRNQCVCAGVDEFKSCLANGNNLIGIVGPIMYSTYIIGMLILKSVQMKCPTGILYLGQRYNTTLQYQ